MEAQETIIDDSEQQADTTQQLSAEDKKEFDDFCSDLDDRQNLKTVLLAANLKWSAEQPDDGFFRKLDSSFKRNSAFVKKLRNLTESQKDSLTSDFEKLNLTKYIGECAAALVDAKLKMSDVPTALHISSLFHQRYAEFASVFLECWQKILLTKKDEHPSNPSKFRVDLRFFADLNTIGVFSELKEALPLLANQLSILTNGDKADHLNLSIVSSFVRFCGDDYAGLMSKRFSDYADISKITLPHSSFLTPERQSGCRGLLKDYFASVKTHLVRDHKSLHKMERQNHKIIASKGELMSDRKELYDNTVATFEKFVSSAAIFADLVQESMPDLPKQVFEDDIESEVDIFLAGRSEFEFDPATSLWEDEDTRDFYEKIPDLRYLFPGMAVKKDSSSDDVKEEPPDTPNDDEKDEEVTADELEREMESAVPDESHDEDRDSPDKEPEEDEPEPADAGTQSIKILMESFVSNLPKCVNRELIDKAAIDFCTNLNTKNHRKKLIKTIFGVPRTRYDLLPFYARLVGTLNPCLDIAEDLCSLLTRDFRWHIRKKDQINIESKLKTVRLIGELVKFKMFSSREALNCLKMLLTDFSHHNIEMACAFLESCGRFLYRTKETFPRTRALLEIMMRKNKALHLDSRYSDMIENAFYYSNPPETPAARVIERTPMEQYIRRLFLKDLNKSSVEKVLRLIRKLNWNEPEVVGYVHKYMFQVWNVKFNTIHCMASLLAGLAKYHEKFVVHLIDCVLEDIRVTMEINHPKFNQRRVTMVRYLGELYNYKLVESVNIFQTLYSFITFGISTDASSPSPLDPPEHLFRLRLSCTLLDTCGQYFDSGLVKKKLNCYLSYLQAYFWYKKSLPVWTDDQPFPIEVENVFRDVVEMLRPKFKFAKNSEEAADAVKMLELMYQPKIESAVEQLRSKAEPEHGLPVIEEDQSDGGMSPRSFDAREDVDFSDDDDNSPVNHSQNRDLTQSGEEEPFSDDEQVLSSEGKIVVQRKRIQQSEEDEDFMTAFDKMMAETITARTLEATRAPQAEFNVPTQLRNQVKTNPGDEEDTEVLEPPNTMNFALLTKKGNKQQLMSLQVPADAGFAVNFRQREVAARAEKEEMKEVVLKMQQRQEQEEVQQEMLAAAISNKPNPGPQRERKQKYQHPKGVPDVDAIFGSRRK